MRFEKEQVYDFEYSRSSVWNGDTYLILKYNGSETLPGYEDDEWVYRVKILDFQYDWEPEDWQGLVIPCLVKGYQRDQWGYETTFPYLVQDINYILRKKYQEGGRYEFEIIGVPGEENFKGEVNSSYFVRDEYGFSHYLHAEGLTYTKGEMVSLCVKTIERKHLYFENPNLDRLRELFEIGSVYEFEVLKSAKTKSGDVFFVVKDKLIGISHHYYDFHESEDSCAIGEIIKLRIKDFTAKGWLMLENPVDALQKDELERIALLEDNALPATEGQYLEYKSSFVYTPKGECDIDKQLGYEIMRQIAAFMNADGGELRIGYNDDGTLCGINEDLQYINSSNEDYNVYDLSEDKIRLKFINTIDAKLGSLAAMKVDVKLFQNNEKKMVCHILVDRMQRPVWLNGTNLFVRCQNSVRRLKGPDITDYICERCVGNVAPAPITPIAEKVKDTDITPVAEKADLSSFVPSPRAKNQEVWKHFTLYKNGKVSLQSAPVSDRAEPDDEVLSSIPVGAEYNKADGRLLFCYDNGRVNVMTPIRLKREKLTRDRRLYSNGYYVSAEENVKMLYAFACHKDDYLIIRSRMLNGKEMIKAVQLSNYTSHDAMQTKGNRFLKQELATPVSMQIVPAAHMSFIYDIISKSKDRYAPGHSVEAEYCKNALAYLEKHGKNVKRIEY